jgi:hypothetical protein
MLKACLVDKFPELIKEWDFEKNDFYPHDISPCSHKRAWWRCLVCLEGYEARIDHRTNMKSNCPFCAGSKASLSNCLATKLPEIAKEWHTTLNGSLTANDITCGSHKKAWWICSICKESYRAVVKDRQHNGCPYCSGRKACSWNCLATKKPNIASQWHPILNGNLTAKDVTCGSGIKAWWVCDKCKKSWKAIIVDRAGERNSGCPHCNLYYQEEKIRLIFEKLTGKKFPKTRSIPWLLNSKTKRKYEADGYCADLNIIFEHQGEQHCCAICKFHPKELKDFFYQIHKDADKYRLCKDNGCLLICTYYNQSDEEVEKYIKDTLISNNIYVLEKS